MYTMYMYAYSNERVKEKTNSTLPIGVASRNYKNIPTSTLHPYMHVYLTHTDLITIVPNIQLLVRPQIVILLPILSILHLPHYTCGTKMHDRTVNSEHVYIQIISTLKICIYTCSLFTVLSCAYQKK